LTHLFCNRHVDFLSMTFIMLATIFYLPDRMLLIKAPIGLLILYSIQLSTYINQFLLTKKTAYRGGVHRVHLFVMRHFEAPRLYAVRGSLHNW
jgi:hypothetical protein